MRRVRGRPTRSWPASSRVAEHDRLRPRGHGVGEHLHDGVWATSERGVEVELLEDDAPALREEAPDADAAVFPERVCVSRCGGEHRTGRYQCACTYGRMNRS